MAAERQDVEFRSYRSDAHSWAMAARAPDPRLKPYVSDHTGYSEQASLPMRRLQPPLLRTLKPSPGQPPPRICCGAPREPDPIREDRGQEKAESHVLLRNCKTKKYCKKTKKNR